MLNSLVRRKRVRERSIKFVMLFQSLMEVLQLLMARSELCAVSHLLFVLGKKVERLLLVRQIIHMFAAA